MYRYITSRANNEIAVLNDDFLCFRSLHILEDIISYKLFKCCSRVNTHKYFFSNRVVEIWNALPPSTVASSSSVFKLMLDFVDLAKFCL